MADTKGSLETNVETILDGDELILGVDVSGGTPTSAVWTIDTQAEYSNIHNYGMKISWVSVDGYSISTGSRSIEKSKVSKSSSYSISGLSLANSTLYYIYLYDNSGLAGFEESTTAPTWNTTYRYWQKTGDASRRRIGTILTDSGGDIVDFLITLTSNDRVAECVYMDDATHNVLTAGTSASWASVDISAFAPKAITHTLLRAKIKTPAATSDGVLGLSPKSLSVTGSRAPYAISNDGAAVIAGKYIPPPFWAAMITDQTYYYIMQASTGSPEAELDVQGFRYDI